MKRKPKYTKKQVEEIALILFNSCKDEFNDPYHIDPFRMCWNQACSLLQKKSIYGIRIHG